MDFGASYGEIALLAAALLAGGFVTGILAGLFGLGGGGVLVPILYEVFGAIGTDEAIRMHVTVGTALAVIIPTSIRSFMSHKAKGAVDMQILRNMAVPVIIGVLFGALIASVVDGSWLRVVYASAVLLIAVKLLFAREEWQIGKDLPGNPLAAIYGWLVGFVSTLIGVGGGVFITAFMTLYKRPIHQAVATASGFGPIISIPAAIGFVIAGWGVANLPPGSIGYVCLLGAALVAPTSVLGAPLGVRIAHGISRRTLEIAFGVFLVCLSARFYWTLF